MFDGAVPWSLEHVAVRSRGAASRLLLNGGIYFLRKRRNLDAKTKVLFRQWHFSGVWTRDPNVKVEGSGQEVSAPTQSKSPPFGFAQGRLSYKGREKWGAAASVY